MISPVEFSKKLVDFGFETTIGVPDSTFRGLISYFSSQEIFTHIVASSECEAMGIASGYYLASGRPALVYMQNSGFCKTLNPYTSLLSADVYSLPALMMVGWRGEPGINDEPQHKMMGRIMAELLATMELDYAILEPSSWYSQMANARDYINERERPFVLLVRKGFFDAYDPPQQSQDHGTLTREDAIKIIVAGTDNEALFISTTGKTSRELFEIRQQKGDHQGQDFYTVGSMGCTSSIAFGVGLAESRRTIYALDGDGAALMQMGTMATIGHYKNSRLKHIIFDNNAHESTGGQPTVSNTVDFAGIASSCGYDVVRSVDNEKQLTDALKDIKSNGKLSLLVIKVKKGSRSDLGRPTSTPRENRDAFMANFR